MSQKDIGNVTNLERLKKGFLNISSNAILIKLNQIGTV